MTNRTRSYNPRIDAIDAWSTYTPYPPEYRDDSTDAEDHRFSDVNIIKVADPPIFNPKPFSDIPTLFFGIPYEKWEQAMKEKLKAYSSAHSSIRMAYVLSRLGEKPRAYLDVRMSTLARCEFKNTDEMFEVLRKVYGGQEERNNEAEFTEYLRKLVHDAIRF
ncbi:hypothetical protein EAE96_005105 [Botrytis aclada]|nr:hypothetical protein EAE96_005105 [Botrytis aclada]